MLETNWQMLATNRCSFLGSRSFALKGSRFEKLGLKRSPTLPTSSFYKHCSTLALCTEVSTHFVFTNYIGVVRLQHNPCRSIVISNKAASGQKAVQSSGLCFTSAGGWLKHRMEPHLQGSHVQIALWRCSPCHNIGHEHFQALRPFHISTLATGWSSQKTWRTFLLHDQLNLRTSMTFLKVPVHSGQRAL